MRKIRVLCFLCVLCLFLSFWGCDISEQTLEKTYFEYFDTVITITLYDSKDEELIDTCFDYCKDKAFVNSVFTAVGIYLFTVLNRKQSFNYKYR